MNSHIEVHVRPRSLAAAFLALAVLATMIAFWPLATLLPRRESAPRSKAASDLRQIGQASLIYASDNRDSLPTSDNIWDYARELARRGGLNDARMWVIEGDPANKGAVAKLGTVLEANGTVLDPAFRKLAPSWAVPLGRLNTNMPSTMPIAWTRGLRPDGTWASHSPNGTEGGHIVFFGGNVAFYRDVRDALHRYDGKGMTSNILEALPPGTRIGEYVPNEREQAAWTWARRLPWLDDVARPAAIPVAWLLAAAVVIVQFARGRWPAWVAVWFVGLSLIVAIMNL